MGPLCSRSCKEKKGRMGRNEGSGWREKRREMNYYYFKGLSGKQPSKQTDIK